MIVFLVRHAAAFPEQPGFPDAARHLTAEGRAAARAVGDRLRWYDCTPTAVWTSPAVRAVQTAEMLVGGLGWSGVVESVPALEPGGDVRPLPPRLAELDRDAHVLVIGHEPAISGLGALLSGRSDFPALKKSQVARLDAHPGEPHMELRWLFGPGDDAPVPLHA